VSAVSVAGAGKLRILLVAYCFPPMNTIASHRPYGWARTWSELGHEVHVLTPAKRGYDGPLDLDWDLAGIRVHETGAPARRPPSPAGAGVERWERIKRLTRRARFSLAMFGDPRLLAYFALVREGERLARAERFDLIVATSPPEVAFFAARTLSRRTRIPWVADFRDLWFQDTRLQQSRMAAALSGPVHRWLVRNAAALVTVSKGLQKRLAGHLGREVLLSYNGYFDEASTPASPPRPADGRVHIVYTGRVYPERQDPEPLFRALAALKRAPGSPAGRLVVDFYGHENPWLAELAARYPLDDQVRLHGHVPHRASLAAQRSADVLLFLDWTDPAAEGVLTGKLFEYFGSARPIMALGRKDSEPAGLIEKTGSGVTLATEEEIKAYLTQLAALPSPPAPGPVPDWLSRRRQARAVLDELRARIQPGSGHP
jgi:glycosyltransferase involved in cell wall biosynthesis